MLSVSKHMKYKCSIAMTIAALNKNKPINLIVASCIFVESLQFINQRMHI